MKSFQMPFEFFKKKSKDVVTEIGVINDIKEEVKESALTALDGPEKDAPIEEKTEEKKEEDAPDGGDSEKRANGVKCRTTWRMRVMITIYRLIRRLCLLLHFTT